MANELVSLQNISKTYQNGKIENLVLNNINLNILSGQKIAIVGPSGIGKTTLLNIIGLIIKPTSGDIFIESNNIKNSSEKDMAKFRNKFFGYIMQDFALVEEDTVFDNVVIPLLYSEVHLNKAKRIELVKNVLEKVSLSEKIFEKAKNLSGGQRQRVAIARAIVNNPKILLCDEPTGSLDNKTGEEIFSLLEKVTNKDKALLMVTHNLKLADRCEFKINIDSL